MRELEKNELLLCAVKDSVTGQFRFLTPKNNIMEFIRDSVPVVSQSFPLKDCKPYEVGIWNLETGHIEDVLTKHEWNEYEFPSDKILALAPLARSESELRNAYDKETKEMRELLKKVSEVSKRFELGD